MHIKVHKADRHASFCVRKCASGPLVLWLVHMMLAATDAGCVQTARARDAPSDSCSLCSGYPFGGLKYRNCRDPWRAPLWGIPLVIHATNLALWWIELDGLVKPSTSTEHKLQKKNEYSSYILIWNDLCFCQLRDKVILVSLDNYHLFVLATIGWKMRLLATLCTSVDPRIKIKEKLRNFSHLILAILTFLDIFDFGKITEL
jgi:hypothetical protein